jgi:hypothetical protein
MRRLAEGPPSNTILTHDLLRRSAPVRSARSRRAVGHVRCPMGIMGKLQNDVNPGASQVSHRGYADFREFDFHALG